MSHNGPDQSRSRPPQWNQQSPHHGQPQWNQPPPQQWNQQPPQWGQQQWGQQQWGQQQWGPQQGNQQQWGQAPPPPKRSPLLRAMLIALVAGVIFVVAFGIAVIVQQQNQPVSGETARTRPPIPPPTTAQPTTTAPTTTAPASPEPTATEPTTTEPTTTEPSSPETTDPSDEGYDDATLHDNALYGEKIKPSACKRQPGPVPGSTKAYKKYINQVFGCLNRAYEKPLRNADFTLDTPSLQIYKGSVETPCGRSPEGYAVFYCGPNETIYATKAALDNYTYLRLGLFYALFHEYAHHVQQRTGILDASYVRDEDPLVVSRRIELQAECLMGMTLKSVRSVNFTAADRRELNAWRDEVPDDIHGTSASQKRWIKTGLNTKNFGVCSTWEASKSKVR